MKINEDTLEEKPTIFQRFKHAFLSVMMGIVLVQMFLFWLAFQHGSFNLHISVVFLMNKSYFIAYITICAVMGWFKGQKFIDWLNYKIGFWKFW